MTTNASIILTESLRLMKEGVLKGCGQYAEATFTNDEGEEVTETVELPEIIHTFNGWKQLGFKVKKGEHAIAAFPIWKPRMCKTEKEDEDPSEERDGFFLKKSHWFKASQVEPLEKKQAA